MQTGWSEQDVSGKKCLAYHPATPHEHGYVVLFLHDVQPTLPPLSPVWQSHLERHGLRVIAPVTGHSWWADRVVREFDAELTPESFVRSAVVPWVDQAWCSTPPRLAIIGIGMGGQAALRMAYKHPDTFPVTVGVSPDLDYQYRILEGDEVLWELYGGVEAARQDSAILHIHPLNWPRHQFFCCDPQSDVFDGVDRLRMKLSSIGVPFEIDIETTPPSGVPYQDAIAPRVIDFVMDKLDRERLRIV